MNQIDVNEEENDNQSEFYIEEVENQRSFMLYERFN